MSETLLRDLRQPEYLHVLLNPLPIYGLAAGLLALFIALLLRSRKARITGFIVIIICSASAWPVYEIGEQGYDPVLSMSDDQGQAWLQSHKARAEKFILLFYVFAAVASAGLIASWKSDKLSFISSHPGSRPRPHHIWCRRLHRLRRRPNPTPGISKRSGC